MVPVLSIVKTTSREKKHLRLEIRNIGSSMLMKKSEVDNFRRSSEPFTSSCESIALLVCKDSAMIGAY
jgi:hypothetical protein